ncbi:MAG: outer membrane protein [Tabrizicola sp.]
MASSDWSGPYAGLSYGRTTADITFPSGRFNFGDGQSSGVYAGYLWQRGTLVYGAELAYGSVSGSSIVGFPLDTITSSLDLKARVGAAANKALFYGVLGYSQVDYEDTTIPPPRAIDLDGLAFGIGAEFMVSERMTLGLEYLKRKGSGTASDNPAITAESSFGTLGLRLGLSF